MKLKTLFNLSRSLRQPKESVNRFLDHPQILALYNLLIRMSENPMVALNRAVAVAMVHGATTGLQLLDSLKADARLANHHRLDAVRAHLLELAGDLQCAVIHYRAAASKTGSPLQ